MTIDDGHCRPSQDPHPAIELAIEALRAEGYTVTAPDKHGNVRVKEDDKPRELEAKLQAAEPFRAWVREHGDTARTALEYAVRDAYFGYRALDALQALLEKGES